MSIAVHSQIIPCIIHTPNKPGERCRVTRPAIRVRDEGLYPLVQHVTRCQLCSVLKDSLKVLMQGRTLSTAEEELFAAHFEQNSPQRVHDAISMFDTVQALLMRRTPT